MKNNIIITCYTCFLFLFGSCDSFLEEYSQDLTYAKTAADLDEILIGDGYMKVSTDLISLGNSDGYYFPWLHVMDDDHCTNIHGWSADGSVFTNFAVSTFGVNTLICVREKRWTMSIGNASTNTSIP